MKMELEDLVVDKLRTVVDPEIQQNVFDAGLIPELFVSPLGVVELTFRPSSTVCPLAWYLGAEIKKGVLAVPGIKKVKIRVIDFVEAEKLEHFLE